MSSVSTAICAAKLRRPISNAMTTEVIPTSTSSRNRLKKKVFARKRWKVVRSKRSVATARKFWRDTFLVSGQFGRQAGSPLQVPPRTSTRNRVGYFRGIHFHHHRVDGFAGYHLVDR